jgi:hypothetical protein
VYALRDPRDRRLFYIGKGKGNRLFQHAAAALEASNDELVGMKLQLIREIHAESQLVDAYVVRHGIPSERQAYEVEAAVIDALRLIDPQMNNEFFNMTNVVLGHHHALRGLAHVDMVASLYSAPRSPDITVPSILFRIPRLWTPQMPPPELYEATMGWWPLGPRREGAKYAFSVSKGVVRAIYRIQGWRQRHEQDRDWQQDQGKAPRWGFHGSVAPEMSRYLNHSVVHLYKKGERGPFKYINC